MRLLLVQEAGCDGHMSVAENEEHAGTTFYAWIDP
jgi:hypothetical protein